MSGVAITQEQIDNWFIYHPPTEVQVGQYLALRDAAKKFAQCIVGNCPPGPDTTAAVRKVREAVMTANAAIACN